MTVKNNNTRKPEHSGHKWLGNEHGGALILVLLTLMVLGAFAILAIDIALVIATRTQLSSAADAAALAGATGLIEGSEALAVERAIEFAGRNKAVQEQMAPVTISESDVSFPEADVIRVRTHRTMATDDPLRTYFLKFAGPANKNLADVTAVAAAKVFDICGSKCLKPWAIPDRWDDADGDGDYDAGEYYAPDVTGYNAPADVGQHVILKMGNPKNTLTSGFFYAIDFPPVDKYPGEDPLTGGRWYETFIRECEPYVVEPGDMLQIEPGNMVGPTMHGLEALIAQDPNAKWDPGSKKVVNSAYGQSPRIGLIPFIDPTQPPKSGRNYVIVVKLGAFFIESTGPGSQVNGRFVMITTQGKPCPGGVSSSFVKNIVLVE